MAKLSKLTAILEEERKKKEKEKGLTYRQALSSTKKNTNEKSAFEDLIKVQKEQKREIERREKKEAQNVQKSLKNIQNAKVDNDQSKKLKQKDKTQEAIQRLIKQPSQQSTSFLNGQPQQQQSLEVQNKPVERNILTGDVPTNVQLKGSDKWKEKIGEYRKAKQENYKKNKEIALQDEPLQKILAMPQSDERDAAKDKYLLDSNITWKINELRNKKDKTDEEKDELEQLEYKNLRLSELRRNNDSLLDDAILDAGRVWSNTYNSVAYNTDLLLQSMYNPNEKLVDTRNADIINSIQSGRVNTTQALNDNYGEWAGFLYQTGLSISDNIGLRLLNAFLPGASLVGMASNATAAKALEVGQTDDATAFEQLGRGLTSGGIEYLTERISFNALNNLLGSNNSRSIFRGMVKQAFEEGREEGLSYIGNLIADMAWGDEVDWSWSEFGQSILGGAISGGVMGGPANYIGNKRFDRMASEFKKNANVQQSFKEYANIDDISAMTDKEFGDLLANTFEDVKKDLGEEQFNKLTVNQIVELAPHYMTKGEKLMWDAGNTLDFKRALDMKSNDLFTAMNSRALTKQKLSQVANDYGLNKKTVERIAGLVDSTGVNVVFTTDMEGQENADGYYKNGTIYINPNGSKPYMQTLKHELTHHIQYNPEFKEIKNYLISEYQGTDKSAYRDSNGNISHFSFDELVNRTAQRYAEAGVNLSVEDAEFEALADLVYQSELFADEKGITALTNTHTDSALKGKIANFFDDMAKRFKGDGEYVNELNRIRNLYTSSAKFNNLQSDEFNDPEYVVNTTNPDGTETKRFSIATYEQGGREYCRAWFKSLGFDEADIEDGLAKLDETYKLAKELSMKMNDDSSLAYPKFSSWSKAKLIKKADGTPLLSIITPNGDYAMNIDFSQVCVKRKSLNKVMNILAKEGYLDNKILKQADIASIVKIIKRNGLEVACGSCFVDSKRYRVSEWANSFTNDYNSLVKSLVPKNSNINIDQFNFTGRNVKNPSENLLRNADDSELDFSFINKIIKENSSGTAIRRYAEAIKNNKELRSILNASDILASEGLDKLRIENQELYKLVNSHQGSAKPKLSHDEVPIGNDILLNKKFKKEDAYAVGGVRVQSFSDYVASMFFDYMQMVQELQMKELPAHAYTKEYYFAKIFGKTGMKINMSIMPKAANLTPEQQARFNKMTKAERGRDSEWLALKRHAGLDANGNYILEDETFPLDKALELQNMDGYDKNVGIIWMGVSDAHIEKMLKDPNVPFIIPYHKSSINATVARMRNVDMYKDYTKLQNTRYKSSGKKVPSKYVKFDFYADLAKTQDPKQTARNYVKYCEENDFIPKFDKWAYGEYADEYYKLLIDFRVYDKNGNYAPQQAVKMEFDDTLVTRDGTTRKQYEWDVIDSLAEYEDTTKNLNDSTDKIVKEVVNELKLSQNKYSISDNSDKEKALQIQNDLLLKDKLKPSDLRTYVNSVDLMDVSNQEKEERINLLLENMGTGLFGRAFVNDYLYAYKNGYNSAQEYLEEKRRIQEEESQKRALQMEEDRKRREEEHNRRTALAKESALSSEEHTQNAIKEFGTTNNFKIAGYILTDGQMLKFGQKGNRGTDHRAIASAFNNDELYDRNNGPGTTALTKFLNEGNIRIIPETNGLDIAMMPTKSQIDKISKFIDSVYGQEFMVDFSDANGNVIDSKYYDYANSKILDDIKEYYSNEQVKYSISPKNSNGELLSEGQRKFFNKSKVVDNKGNLQVVYHGTPNGEFNVFDADRIGETTDEGDFGRGFYFTEVKEGAESYAEGENAKIYQTYLNLVNPLRLDKYEQYDKIYLENRGKISHEDILLQIGLTDEEFQKISYAVEKLEDDWEGLSIEELGFDGVIEGNDDGHIYVAINSNQIKNIDNLNPTNSNDIRYSISSKYTNDLKDILKKYGSLQMRNAQEVDAILSDITKEIATEGTFTEDNKNKLLEAIKTNVMAHNDLNDGNFNVYEDIKNKYKGTRIYVDEKYRDFVKEHNIVNKLKGLFTLTYDKANSDTSIDKFYTDVLASEYAEYFEEVYNEEDQLLNLANVKDFKVNERKTLPIGQTNEFFYSEEGINNDITKYLNNMKKRINMLPDNVKKNVSDVYTLLNAERYVEKNTRVQNFEKFYFNNINAEAAKALGVFTKRSENTHKLFQDAIQEIASAGDITNKTRDAIVNDLVSQLDKTNEIKLDEYTEQQMKFFKADTDSHFKSIVRDELNNMVRDVQFAMSYADGYMLDDKAIKNAQIEYEKELRREFKDAKVKMASEIVGKTPEQKLKQMGVFDILQSKESFDRTNAEFDQGIENGEDVGKITSLDAAMINELRENGIDETSFNKTLSQNLDKMAGKNVKLREMLRACIERPLDNAKKRMFTDQKYMLEKVSKAMKEFGIQPGSKESAAVQWFGEGTKDTNDPNAKPYTLVELQQEFPNKWQDIVECEKFCREMYDQYLERLNRSRQMIYPNPMEQAYNDLANAQQRVNKYTRIINDTKTNNIFDDSFISKQHKLLEAAKQDVERITKAINNGDYTLNKIVPKRKDYFHHFQEMTEDSGNILGMLNNPNDYKISNKLSGLSEGTKPKSKFTGIMQHRKHGDYDADALGGLLRYIPTAEYAIHIDPQTAHLRGIIKAMRDSSNADDTDLAYTINFLTHFTNNLAGKTFILDRIVTDVIPNGRKVMKLLKTINSRVKGNAILGNMRSAISQFYNLPTGLSMIANPNSMAKGAMQYAKYLKGDQETVDLMNQSSFLQERYFDKVKTELDLNDDSQIKKMATWMMQFGDEVVSRNIWFGAYQDALAKNMGKQESIEYADNLTRNAVAGRGIGEVPLLQQSEVVKLIAPFQVEVNNQWQYIKKLTNEVVTGGPEEKKKAAWQMLVMFAATWAMNELREKFLDGNRTGMDMVDAFIDVSESIAEDDISLTSTVGRLGGEVLSNVPYASQITPMLLDEKASEALFGDADPTRFGTQNIGISGLVSPLVQAAQGKNVDLQGLAFDYLTPWGGAQLDRTLGYMQDRGWIPEVKVNTKEGISLNQNEVAGSYADNGQLRYALNDESIPETIRGLLFGTTGTQTAKDYYDNDAKSLSASKTDAYVEARNAGATYKEMDGVMDEVTKFEGQKDKDGDTITYSKGKQTYEYIDSLTMNNKAKETLYKNYALSDTQKEIYNQAVEAGGSYSQLKDAMFDLSMMESIKDSKGRSIANSRGLQMAKYINEMSVSNKVKQVLRNAYLSDKVKAMSIGEVYGRLKNIGSGKSYSSSSSSRSSRKSSGRKKTATSIAGRLSKLLGSNSSKADAFIDELKAIVERFEKENEVR